MKKFLLLLASLTCSYSGWTQDEQHHTSFKVTGYLETYYAFDSNKPIDNTLPGFMYSYNRHNEFNLNLGFIKGTYTKDKVRANLALMAGTYANANLTAEPGVLKNIFEANAGVRLSPSKDIWIDAGIFASHIGFESAIGKDCWTLTRSILADNTPYYESGVRISYTTDDGRWYLSGLVLNGWQRIQRVSGNSLPSFGTQITFKPTDAITLNSSTFVGTDKPDSARQMRYFHNFYGIFQVSKTFALIAGFDYGIEAKSGDGSSLNPWYSPVLIARYQMTDKMTIAVRGEYYVDTHGVIIVTATPNGFKTIGASLNFDYAIADNVLWRLEVRQFKSKDSIFSTEDSTTSISTLAVTSLAISF